MGKTVRWEGPSRRGWLRRLRARQWNERAGWHFAGSFTDREPGTDWPVDFWQYDWVKIGTMAELRDPLYGQRRMVPLWFVEVDGKRHGFAAEEFSNGVWVFFLPV